MQEAAAELSEIEMKGIFLLRISETNVNITAPGRWKWSFTSGND